MQIVSKSLKILLRTEWLICLFLSIAAFLGASLLLAGWPKGLSPELISPYNYDGDGLAYLWNVQRALEGTWYFENVRSGFPFGSNHLDYPTSDTGSYLVLKFLGLLFNSSIAAVNLYYLIGFSICTVSSYLVARSLDISRYFSLLIAFIYTFTSFHFGRIGHLFFTWYFVAPLFFYIGFRLFGNKLIFTEEMISLKTKAINLLALIILASFGIYYAFFGCIVIFLCSIIAAVFYRSYKYLLEGFFTLSFIVLGVLLNVLPSLMTLHSNGENHEGVNRLAAESEFYALKITQLLLPRGDHRLDSFFEFTQNYNSTFPLITENVSASLGVIGSIGFLFLISVVFISPFYQPKQCHSTKLLRENFLPNRLQIMAAVTLGLVLIGTVGGFSSLFAMLISSSIRSWNRISIFIAFTSVTAFAIALDWLIINYIKSYFVKTTQIFFLLFLLIFGISDQTVKPCHSCLLSNSKLAMNDKLFIRAIENTVPQHSAIYQLPYMAYPENGPINSLGSYDQARGHVHSKHLKWSFGGMRGREGDWFYRKLSTLPINEQVSIISAMGFAGVYIDRRGYLGTLPQSDHRCTTLSSSQIERLKNNCMTIEELEQRISDAIATFDPQQKLISQDHQLVFIPLPARASLVNHIDEANAYLLPIGFKLESGTPVQLQSGFETAIDLRKDDPDLPVYVGSVKGLAGVSIANGVRVGRWSDALVDKRVTFWLAKPLPKKFTLHIRAQAAGLNVGKPMQVKIGNQTQNLIFGSEFETKTIKFEVDKPVYKIEFKPADPFSPARRWGIGENRLIAILFQEVLIVPD